MKNSIRKTTGKFAAILAALTAMSTFAAVSASASDAENEEIIAAAKANAALHETWDDVEKDPANEDEIDQVYDLLERLDITADCFNGEDNNCYIGSGSQLTHEQVMEIIRNAHPTGCIRNPFNISFGADDDDDDDEYETVYPEEDTGDDGDEDDDGESCFNFDFDFFDGFTDQLFG